MHCFALSCLNKTTVMLVTMKGVPMTPEETAVVSQAETEELTANLESTDSADESEDEEDFNPLGNIEGWSAFECSSGPFGHRG
jgi:hypothetical protein